jgi:hypothetical protein
LIKRRSAIYAWESDELDNYYDRGGSIQTFHLEGNNQLVKSPVVMRIKPRNHSNTKTISVELEGPEPFPHGKNICVIGEPLHVAYI